MGRPPNAHHTVNCMHGHSAGGSDVWVDRYLQSFANQVFNEFRLICTELDAMYVRHQKRPPFIKIDTTEQAVSNV